MEQATLDYMLAPMESMHQWKCKLFFPVVNTLTGITLEDDLFRLPDGSNLQFCVSHRSTTLLQMEYFILTFVHLPQGLTTDVCHTYGPLSGVTNKGWDSCKLILKWQQIERATRW